MQKIIASPLAKLASLHKFEIKQELKHFSLIELYELAEKAWHEYSNNWQDLASRHCLFALIDVINFEIYERNNSPKI